jgi:esterase/lipase
MKPIGRSVRRTGSAVRRRFLPAVTNLANKVRAEERLQLAADSAGLILRPGMAGFFLPETKGQAKGTVVLFHGYTAGPWQYRDMAAKIHKAGYNVYAPRIPGHGLMSERSGMATGQDIIRSGQSQKYDAFVDAVFKDAAALGAPVYVAGLSGGGNLALRMAERNPVAKTFAMAPFLGSNYPLRAIPDFMRFLNWLSFGLLFRALNRVPRGKNAPGLSQIHPHTQASWGQVFAMRDVGMRVRKVETPVQFVTTADDVLSGTWPVARLFRRSGGEAAGHGWFHFGPEAKVPHAMVSRQQNKAPGAVTKIERILLDFFGKGKATNNHP